LKKPIRQINTKKLKTLKIFIIRVGVRKHSVPIMDVLKCSTGSVVNPEPAYLDADPDPDPGREQIRIHADTDPGQTKNKFYMKNILYVGTVR
jgi:hypothetical protein